MTSLIELLNRDYGITQAQVDRALERQQAAGGEFDTCLLETGAISEESLTKALAAVAEMAPALPSEVERADPGALARLFPHLSRQYAALPYRIEHGKLLVAVSAAPTMDLRTLVERAASMPVDFRLCTAFRLSWGLTRYAGAAINDRFLALERTLHDLSKAPPAGASTGRVRAAALAALSSVLEDDEEETPSESESEEASTEASSEVQQPPAEAEAPEVSPPMEESKAVETTAVAETKSDVPSGELTALEAPPAATEAVVAVLAEQISHDSEPSEGVTHEPSAPPAVALMSFEQGRDALTLAGAREEVVGVLLEYCAQRFEFSAAFVVQAEQFEGFDVRASVPVSVDFNTLRIPTENSGALRVVREKREAMVGNTVLTVDGGALARMLGRGAVSSAAILPVQVGNRVVMELWIDAGLRVLEPQSLAELSALTVLAGESFARIIRDKKKQRTEQTKAAPTAAYQLPSADVRWGASAMGVTSERSDEPTGTSLLRTVVREEGEENTGRYVQTGRAGLSDVVEVLPPTPSTAPPSAELLRVPTGAHGTLVPELLRMVEGVLRSGTATNEVTNALLGAGDRGLDAVFAYFPGPVSAPRETLITKLRPLAEVGPLLRLVVLFRQASVPRLLQKLDLPDPEQRFFAALCCTELVHPLVLTKLLPRLFDPDPPTRSAVLEAMRAHRKLPELEETLWTLRSIAQDSGALPERRARSAMALGELRDVGAVPALINTLQAEDANVQAEAHRALVLLTRQDFSSDIDGWAHWWAGAMRKHRIEWLMDSLLHNEATLRHEASEELKKLTGQFFGYYYNLPRREREKAHQRYLEWWEREGRSKFTSKSA